VNDDGRVSPLFVFKSRVVLLCYWRSTLRVAVLLRGWNLTVCVCEWEFLKCNNTDGFYFQEGKRIEPKGEFRGWRWKWICPKAEHCFACTRVALCLLYSLTAHSPNRHAEIDHYHLSVRPSACLPAQTIASPNKQFNAYTRLERRLPTAVKQTNSCGPLCSRCKWEVGVFKPISISPTSSLFFNVQP